MDTKKEIEALINLLEDPDTKVYEEVSRNLMDKGIDIIPELEEAWESSANKNHQERIENMIQKIKLNFTREKLMRWISEGDYDMIEGD